MNLMLNNLEYYDSKEFRDYDDICDLIEKVSENHSLSNKEKEFLHIVKVLLAI